MSSTLAAITTAERMDYDDAAWARCDEIFEPWKAKILEQGVLREIGRFIDKHRGGVPDELFAPRREAFNTWLRMQFQDGSSAVIRFPCPVASVFPRKGPARGSGDAILGVFYQFARASHPPLWDDKEESKGSRAVYHHGVYQQRW